MQLCHRQVISCIIINRSRACSSSIHQAAAVDCQADTQQDRVITQVTIIIITTIIIFFLSLSVIIHTHALSHTDTHPQTSIRATHTSGSAAARDRLGGVAASDADVDTQHTRDTLCSSRSLLIRPRLSPLETVCLTASETECHRRQRLTATTAADHRRLTASATTSADRHHH